MNSSVSLKVPNLLKKIKVSNIFSEYELDKSFVEFLKVDRKIVLKIKGDV